MSTVKTITLSQFICTQTRMSFKQTFHRTETGWILMNGDEFVRPLTDDEVEQHIQLRHKPFVENGIDPNDVGEWWNGPGLEVGMDAVIIVKASRYHGTVSYIRQCRHLYKGTWKDGYTISLNNVKMPGVEAPPQMTLFIPIVVTDQGLQSSFGDGSVTVVVDEIAKLKLLM